MNLYRINADGSGSTERLTNSVNGQLVLDWSAASGEILYTEFDPETFGDIYSMSLRDGPESRKPSPYMVTPFHESHGQFSPSSKWVAYTSNESGRDEIYLGAFPAGGSPRRWVVSNTGGAYPRWNPNGTELFYVTPQATLMSVSVAAGRAGEPVIAVPEALFPIPVRLGMVWYDYDVAPDGQRFVVLAPDPGIDTEPLTVVLNFTAGLKTQ
jgi:Tol biopolymer transport system component